jgi:hypothetical protein
MISYLQKKICTEYIAITDHTKSLTLTNGLEKQILEQANKIAEINDKDESDIQDQKIIKLIMTVLT